jgi:hypothetical protein
MPQSVIHQNGPTCSPANKRSGGLFHKIPAGSIAGGDGAGNVGYDALRCDSNSRAHLRPDSSSRWKPRFGHEAGGQRAHPFRYSKGAADQPRPLLNTLASSNITQGMQKLFASSHMRPKLCGEARRKHLPMHSQVHNPFRRQSNNNDKRSSKRTHPPKTSAL